MEEKVGRFLCELHSCKIEKDKAVDKLHHLGKQVESKSKKIPVLVDSMVLWARWTMKHSPNLLSDRAEPLPHLLLLTPLSALSTSRKMLMELCWSSKIMLNLGGYITPPFGSYQTVLHTLKKAVPWNKKGEKKK